MILAKNLFSLALIYSSITFAFAENFEIQNIRVGGLGCPSEQTVITTSPDRAAASVIFQGFESHVPAILTNPKSTPYNSNLNCNIFLDLKMPANLKLDSLEISYDMRGHAFLERGVIGSFKSYLISSNGMGTERSQKNYLLQEKNWLNSSVDQEEDFLLRSNKILPLQSNCGMGSRGDLVTVHLQHQLASQITGGYERTNTSGTITMDTSDVTGGIKIRASVSSCRGPVNPGPIKNCRVVRINGRAQTVCE
jgi:hypothetical protein